MYSHCRGVFVEKATQLAEILRGLGFDVAMNEKSPRSESFVVMRADVDDPIIDLTMKSPYSQLVSMSMDTVAQMVVEASD